MKSIQILSLLLGFLNFQLMNADSQNSAISPTLNNYYNTPQVIYDNSLTTPPLTNPSTTLPGAPTSSSFGLPGQETTSQTVAPGNFTTPTSPSLLDQLYQQPAQPNLETQPQPTISPTLTVQQIPYESIKPPTTYLPGLATIKNKRWMVTDYLYNLTPNIGVKVELIKPESKYIPLSANLLEKKIATIFDGGQIKSFPEITDCHPPLPIFYVLVMAYPCEKRVVAFVSAQLYEVAQPSRIDFDLNGVWQVVTWERQFVVASASEDFARQVITAIEEVASSFTKTFQFYHPPLERPCFPASSSPKDVEIYQKYYETKAPYCK